MRRIITVLGTAQLPLSIALVMRGFPFIGPVGGAAYGSSGGAVFWWERVVAALHGPGIALLTILGMCCGFGGGPIGDEYYDAHTPVTVSGAVLLGAANVLAWGFPTYVLVRTIHWLRSRRAGRSRSSAAA